MSFVAQTSASAPAQATPRTAYPFDEIDSDTAAGRYLRRYWQPVQIAADLPPGRARTIRILGDDYLLYRGADGKAHISAARCPHRLIPLSVGWVEGDSVRCLYHGWKFDAAGQCTEQPGAVDPSQAARIRIPTYPVEEYLGLIFGYFGPGTPPPLPRYPVMERPGFLEPETYVRDCNHFQSIENGLDEVHVVYTHANTSFSTSGLNDQVPTITARPTPYGVIQFGHRGERVRETHFLMPNILFLKLPPSLPGEVEWRDYVSWRVPIDRHTHVAYLVQRLSVDREQFEAFQAARRANQQALVGQPPASEIGKRILRNEMTLADVLHRPDLVFIQDYVTQVGQGLVADREHERLAASDAGIIQIRRLWQREMANLMEGRPLTEWSFPAELASTAGM